MPTGKGHGGDATEVVRVVQQLDQQRPYSVRSGPVSDGKVAVVAGEPADDDQVPGDVELGLPFPEVWSPALAAEVDVVQGRVFDEPTADPTAGAVALHHVASNSAGDVVILAVLAAVAQQRAKRRR